MAKTEKTANGNGSGNGQKKSARRNGGIPGKGTRAKTHNQKMSPVDRLMARNLPYAVLVRKLNNLGLHYNSAVASK